MVAETANEVNLFEETNRFEGALHQCSKGWSARCARAKGPKCRCACGGHNHGNPKASRNGHRLNKHLFSDGQIHPLFQPYGEEAITRTPRCKWCDKPLHGPVIGYPHDGGWVVPGLHSGPNGGEEGRWWLFIVCEDCTGNSDYQWALWKLGLPRDWTPEA